jgi:hypothetical protein
MTTAEFIERNCEAGCGLYKVNWLLRLLGKQACNGPVRRVIYSDYTVVNGAQVCNTTSIPECPNQAIPDDVFGLGM